MITLHPADDLAILLPLIVAAMVIVLTIITHALALTAIVHFVRREGRLGRAGVRFWTDVAIVAGAMMLALAAHLTDIAIWTVVLARFGEFSGFASVFYHSAESYTTLGAGDVAMPAAWRLLDPLEAADGMLLFGVSTAMIFAVIQRLVQSRFRESAI
jgi:hypothetical protein